MRFKTNIQAQYEPNSTMSVIKFAWLPKRIGDIMVWFERYEILYMYEVLTAKANVSGKDMEFKTNQWVKISERTI